MIFAKLKLFKRKLFWRVLGIFWLTTTLTIIANIYLTTLISDVENRYKNIQTKLHDMAYDAAAVYESSGEAALQSWYLTQYDRHQIRTLLVDQNNTPIGKAPRKNSRHPKTTRDKPATFPLHRWRELPPSLLEQIVLTSSGRKYTFKVLPSPFFHNALSPSHDYRFYRLLMSLIIIATGSFYLSRSVAFPVKRLTEASEVMADGDLTVRVKDKIGHRSDELGELAEAFDHMAQRIEALVSNQKQLLRDISHEIRTPLTRQQIAIELAKTEEDDHDLLVKIEQQNHKLSKLIDNLLTFSRLSDGSQLTGLDTIELAPMVESICAAAELEAHSRKIQITRNIADTLCFQGNPMLVTRAIDNLLGNALKYSPEHSTISIDSMIDNNEVMIRITDQGAGISEACLPHIFEPFYRADLSRNQESGGYGLGLAIVAQIIKQHHGRIEIKNTEPGGLSVMLYFPLSP